MDTRRMLMQQLLANKESGLTIDELSSHLGISRNAVQQHVTSLERDGLVTTVGVNATGGRPSRAYGLTEKGYESFPRNYAMLAQSLLAAATETLGEDAVEKLLMKMADDLAQSVQARLSQPGGAERLETVIEVMNELGYDASPLPNKEGIAAVNCIYHKLAQQTRAICRYDTKLLSLLLDQAVQHTSCMADGDGQCVFKRMHQ
jgi:DeoR family suf operon transcriptional repressor